MSLFVVNLLLAVLWVFLWGDLSIYTLALGFAFGYATLLLFARIRGRDTLWNAYGRRLFAVAGFAVHFFKLLVKSNLEIAREILTPGMSIQPSILRYDVTGLGETAIVAFSSAVTLTPGTLVVDVNTTSDGRTLLYIHALFARDRAAVVADLDALRVRMERDVLLSGGDEPEEVAA